MNSILKSDCGRPTIEVQYDSTLCNWDEAIGAAYALHGLRPGQARVIATPRQQEKDQLDLFQEVHHE